MHDASIKTKIERLEVKLAVIQKRLQWIAEEEAKSPHINESAHYFKDKDALLKKADIVIDELKKLFNKPWI
jgi:alpha/beta superfamily hydrolase